MKMKNVEDFYPLSPMQQGMLFHSLYAPESGVYVEQMSCTLQGPLDVAAFEQAWKQEIARHSILRTGFVGEGLKEPVQVVHRRVDLPMEQHDWRSLSSVEQDRRREDFLETERRRGFNLSDPPLMRLALMRMADETYAFVWTYHHILLDGWSMPLLFQEVFALYGAYSQGQVPQLRPPRPFRDYVIWLKRQDMGQAEAFWRRTLKGFTAPTPLVVDWPVSSEADEQEQYDEQEITLSVTQTTALQSLVQQHQLTLNTLVQGAWALLLSRYSAEGDVVFGATVSGRPPDLEGSEFMMGLFINTLPVRVQTPPDAVLSSWLRELQAQQAELRQYEYSPLVEIQGWSNVPRGLPLFESILVFENYPVDTSTGTQQGRLAIRDIRSVEQTNYPLTVVAGVDEELLIRIVYGRHRFDTGTIERMLGHLRTLLEGMAEDPARRISALPLLTAAEEEAVLAEWNATDSAYPKDRCVHELFEAQADRAPDAVAVVLENQSLTYGELNARANQLAHNLRAMDVGPETLVGISVERSLEMVIGMLAILKAGGAYLPLDPAYPRDRLGFMMEDAEVRIVLTQCDLLPRGEKSASSASRSFICLDTGWDQIAQKPATSPPSDTRPDNVAYAIYTSGSTGRPKGVLLEHRGLCNLVNAQTKAFDVQSDSRVLQFASFSFDASVSEVFTALLTGATLCLAQQETLTSLSGLLQLLRDEAITIVTLPPSVLGLLPAEELPALETLISAGEACSPDIVARWAPGRRFINAYGPTEATVGPMLSMVDDISPGTSRVPIGRPIDNTQVYLFDGDLRPVPVQVPGELHVGGVGVGRGYWRRPRLTAEKYVPDPFSDEPGARLYKTGDLARLLPDGEVEFLGRIDHQVKVRGFRIELGEIGAVLRQHPALQAAVVLAREDSPGDKRLVAYVVPEYEVAPDIGELRDHLREKLPDYMVPSALVILEALPLTPNGKVDRQALPAPDRERPDLARSYVAPRDALEAQLTRLWEDILDIEPIGVKDDFFELGGHSLLALRLMAQVEQRLGRELSLATLFQGATIEHLATVLRQQGEVASPSSLVPLQRGGSKRPLFFIHPTGGSVHWYADLARHLAPDQPLYGLQAQGLTTGRDLHTSIEHMAAHYVREVRELQPEGPYLLGSWSMGVAVAFEMAQQLYAAGQRVALLALLDQGPSVPTDEAVDDAAYLMDVFGKHVPLSLVRLRELEPDEQVAYVFEKAREVDWIYPDVTLPQFRHFVRMLRLHTEMWRDYEPQPFPGRVTLFRADEQPEDGPEERDMGWGELAAGGVDIRHVPGDHLTMIHEPHVEILAGKLRACLDEIQGEVSRARNRENVDTLM
jgi:amino acid adenylation domain-containing protein